MIILIAGASHTGKTLLAQRLMETYHYPYISIDHLKMGLIRSGNTDLTPMDDDKLTDYLWPIVREMVKTAIENNQNLIVEGCYIPFDWKESFAPDYLKHIHYRCLIMSSEYIQEHFSDIVNCANVIEKRLDDSGLDKVELIRENERNLILCQQNGCEYVLIDDQYDIDLSTIVPTYSVKEASFSDMDLVSDILITSISASFSSFISAQTIARCTDPGNCRKMLQDAYQSGEMSFLICNDQGFICWQNTNSGVEIVALHTLPESWETGLGHALITEALRRIGDQPTYLWAFHDNKRARRFYEKHGFAFEGAQRVSEFDGAIEVRYSKE